MPARRAEAISDSVHDGSGHGGANRDDGVRQALLTWYRAEARDLPWRRTRDPYRIWLSEVMLQQTRVETVIPYYQRWLEAFPDVETLAEADEDAVLKQWEGLGYYRRARNLHGAARHLVADHAGRLPENAAAWQRLAGVGRYTAGAVASIAFGERTPVVDGNVKRVLARLDAVESSIDDAKVIDSLWRRATALVPAAQEGRNDPGDFNQALMELGARVCVPRRPRCLLCPLRGLCEAHATTRAETLPLRAKKRAVRHAEWAAALILRRRRVLFARRPPGLLGGLWELPTTTLAPEEDTPRAVERLLREDLGLTGKPGEEVARVDHAFTHLRVTIRLHRAIATGRARAKRHSELRWQPLEELGALALPVAMRKLVHAAMVEQARSPNRS